MKRIFDILISLSAVLVSLPITLLFILLIFIEDRHSPFYVAKRVARGGGLFSMIKLRSMVVNAHLIGASSTSAEDSRITKTGVLIRRYKLDELMQFWNVLKGDMSVVGPRPQVESGMAVYTDAERKLLTVKPGITDFSSIIFSDEGDILAGKGDPDLAYDQLIRPWKSRLGLVYVTHGSLLLDIQLIFMTAVAVLNKPIACNWVVAKLTQLGVNEDVIEVCKREKELVPHTPPV